MTNAWPKTDEIRSAKPRRVKMIVAIKLYSQIIARITFASFTKDGLQFLFGRTDRPPFTYTRIAAAEFQ